MAPNPSRPSARPSASSSSYRRSRRFHKMLRLFMVMVVFMVLTSVLTALVTGGPQRLFGMIQAIATPDAPRLRLNAGEENARIRPLSDDLAEELMAQLLQPPSSDAEAAAAAVLNKEDPIQKFLKKTKYKPVCLTARSVPGQTAAFDIAPDQVKLFFHFNGTTVAADSLEALAKYDPAVDGTCYILLEARWAAQKSWEASRKGLYCFALQYDRPAVFELNGTAFDPGELLVIYAQYLTADDKVTVQSDLPFSPDFAAYGDRERIALVPLSYDLRPGQYQASLTAGDQTETFQITIKDKEFPIQNLTVKDEVAEATRNAASAKEFKGKIEPVLNERDAVLSWSGETQMPVPGARLSTLFGVRRYVNGASDSYRHTGIDLAIGRGTEIKAVNGGRVIFSEQLTQTGNTILIEHGLGLKSWYYHLDERRVEVGDAVKKGDVIGTVGSTGFSTGPHLHLNLSVNGTYINPCTALDAPLLREPLK